MKSVLFSSVLCICFVFSSCETKEERLVRLQNKEQQRIELAERQRETELRRIEQARQDSIAHVIQLVRERKEREIYEKYLNNSLPNGSTPFAYCYGGNRRCTDYGCSEIIVKTPYNSDVLVTIKKNDIVVRHAYIKAGMSYTFEIPNGTYQPFFYFGKGWNPEKFIKNTSCGELKGGFVSDEYFGKDEPQILDSNILEYELILQEDGNFSTKPSNQNEAF